MESMERYYQARDRLVAVLILLVLVGCAAVGAPAPQNTEQSIAYIYPANGTIRDLASSAGQQKTITKAEAQTILNMTDQVRSAADLARDFAKAGNQDRATANLMLAKSVLREARKYLNLPEDPKLQ